MVPGLEQAKYVQNKIRQAGIEDVQLFFDHGIGGGMWVMCQVMKRGGILLPKQYAQDGIKPHIMFYVKDNEGKFRLPSDQDIMDVIAIRQRAETTFAKGGDWLADQFDKQDAEKYQEGRQKLTERIKSVSKPLKAAVKKELG